MSFGGSEAVLQAVGHGLGGGGAWLGSGGEWLVAHHFVSPDTPDSREPDVSSNVS